jgi:hypothetical protein
LSFKSYALESWAYDGLSAQTIYGFANNRVEVGCNYPHDPDDLCRCIQVLRLLLKDDESAKVLLLSKLADAKGSREYKALADNWIELMKIFCEEWDCCEAHRTYAFMKKIYSYGGDSL